MKRRKWSRRIKRLAYKEKNGGFQMRKRSILIKGKSTRSRMIRGSK